VIDRRGAGLTCVKVLPRVDLAFRYGIAVNILQCSNPAKAVMFDQSPMAKLAPGFRLKPYSAATFGKCASEASSAAES
jgi:hypothetical protein